MCWKVLMGSGDFACAQTSDADSNSNSLNSKYFAGLELEVRKILELELELELESWWIKFFLKLVFSSIKVFGKYQNTSSMYESLKTCLFIAFLAQNHRFSEFLKNLGLDLELELVTWTRTRTTSDTRNGTRTRTQSTSSPRPWLKRVFSIKEQMKMISRKTFFGIGVDKYINAKVFPENHQFSFIIFNTLKRRSSLNFCRRRKLQTFLNRQILIFQKTCLLKAYLIQ